MKAGAMAAQVILPLPLRLFALVNIGGHDTRRCWVNASNRFRGLWVRNGRHYAQVTLGDPKTGVKNVRRVPLENASTPAQAKAALDEMLVRRRKGQTIVQRRAPTFASFAADYLEFHQQAKDTKRASTMETEGHAISRLKETMGSLHLDKIKRLHVDHFIASRQKAGVAPRTVNLEITVLRNVLNRAIDQQMISTLPTENLRPLKSNAAKRALTPITKCNPSRPITGDAGTITCGFS